MRKSISYRFASALATGLGMAAIVLVTPASVFFVNQPAVPKELLK